MIDCSLSSSRLLTMMIYVRNYDITQEEYDNYAGHYKNILEWLKSERITSEEIEPVSPQIDYDYELVAYSHTKIDYEYIINLIQNIVTSEYINEEITPEERQKKIDEVKQYIEELGKENYKVADIMSNIVYQIEVDKSKYRGQSILNIIENMKQECIDNVVSEFCQTWYASKEEVLYAATHYRNKEIPNEVQSKQRLIMQPISKLKKSTSKFKYYNKMMSELRNIMEEEIKPLLSR